MTEYAPSAIQALFDQVKAALPSALMGGIIGDQAHTYGFHRGRNYVSGSDYSVEYPQDHGGDGEAACGLDISWGNAADHYTASQRLLNAANDPRTIVCREFYGSTDGWTVCGYDYTENRPSTSDDSHLWHVHLSIHRQWADDHAALSQFGDVITAGSHPPPGEDDMTPEQVAMLERAAGDAAESRRMLGVLLGWNNPADAREQDAWALAGNAAETRRMAGVQLRWNEPASDNERAVIEAQDTVVEQVQEIKDAVTSG